MILFLIGNHPNDAKSLWCLRVHRRPRYHIYGRKTPQQRHCQWPFSRDPAGCKLISRRVIVVMISTTDSPGNSWSCREGINKTTKRRFRWGLVTQSKIFVIFTYIGRIIYSLQYSSLLKENNTRDQYMYNVYTIYGIFFWI